LKIYQVNAYPTTYLIDKTGLIIAADDDLRGEKLLQTIDQFIQ